MSTEENLSSSILKWTIWILLVALSVLPLINNMNDIMAKLAMTTGLNIYLKRNVVPTMTSTISILLRHVFQIENIAVGSSVFVKAHEVYHELYIGWNCVGWQSLILLLFSIVTGLAGDWSLKSKLKCSIIGLESIIAINIARILAIAMVLIKFGPGTAVLFHDNLS